MKPVSLAEQWREAFLGRVQEDNYAVPLKAAALDERLGDWTDALTATSVVTCQTLQWQAAAKKHKMTSLPVCRNEYLSIDVMAFAAEGIRWRFPAAAIELENCKDDNRIAYSLWKVMCVRAELRIVFCYRREPTHGSELMRYLREEVIDSLALKERMLLTGETVVVVGSRNDSSTFPYGFFKWWRLETNTGAFRLF